MYLAVVESHNTSRRNSHQHISSHASSNNNNTMTPSYHNNSGMTSQHNNGQSSYNNSMYPPYAYELLPQFDGCTYVFDPAFTNVHMPNRSQHAPVSSGAHMQNYDRCAPAPGNFIVYPAALERGHHIASMQSIQRPPVTFCTSSCGAAAFGAECYGACSSCVSPTSRCGVAAGLHAAMSVAPASQAPSVAAAADSAPLRHKQPQTRCKRLNRKLPVRRFRISLSSESDVDFARSLRSSAARSQRTSALARAHLPDLRNHNDADVSETSGADVESDTTAERAPAAVGGAAQLLSTQTADNTAAIVRLSTAPNSACTAIALISVATPPPEAGGQPQSDSSWDTNVSCHGSSTAATASDCSQSSRDHTRICAPSNFMHLYPQPPESSTHLVRPVAVLARPRAQQQGDTYSLDNTAFTANEAGYVLDRPTAETMAASLTSYQASSSFNSIDTSGISPLVSDFPVSGNSETEADVTKRGTGNHQAASLRSAMRQHYVNDPSSVACTQLLEQESLLRDSAESGTESVYGGASSGTPKRCRLNSEAPAASDCAPLPPLAKQRKSSRATAVAAASAVKHKKHAFRAYKLKHAADLWRKQCDLVDLSSRLQALSEAGDDGPLTNSDLSYMYKRNQPPRMQQPRNSNLSSHNNNGSNVLKPALQKDFDFTQRQLPPRSVSMSSEQASLSSSSSDAPPVPPRRTVSLRANKGHHHHVGFAPPNEALRNASAVTSSAGARHSGHDAAPNSSMVIFSDGTKRLQHWFRHECVAQLSV